MMPRLSFKEHTIHPTGCVDQCCSDCMLGAHPPPTGCSLYSLILPLTGVFISNLEHITIQGLLISNIIYNTQHGVVIIGIMVSYFSPQGCLLATQGCLFIPQGCLFQMSGLQMLEKIDYPPHKPSQREFRTVEVFILLENVFHERLSNFNPKCSQTKIKQTQC